MNSVGQTMILTDTLVDAYQQNKGLIQDNSHPFVNDWRDQAMKAFLKLGIPDSKTENYKYTNFQPFFKGSFARVFRKEEIPEPAAIYQCEVPALNAHQVFTINGWLHHIHSSEDLPKGVVIDSFRKFAFNHPEIIKQYYGKAAPVDQDGLVALNTLYAQDGVVIYIPAQTSVEAPIQIVNMLTGDKDLMTTQRNLFIIEENSQARIMVCDHTLTSQKFVMNTVTEVFIGERANGDFYHIQSQHNHTTQVAGTYIRQKPQSVVQCNSLTLHSGIARNNVYVTMDGENCESHLYGLYLNDKNQHVDHFTFIDHAHPKCFSSELYKGVLDDYSSGAFTGKIMVRPDAQQTNAYQSNKNLLLTNDAKFFTRPQLEIYADDVKCSHGATVGQLDQNSLFYLRARGIGQEEARILLMYAFTYEVIEKIKVEALKEQIRGLVEKRFRGELNKCESCVVCGQGGNKITCL